MRVPRARSTAQAGTDAMGRTWRAAYLRLTYGCGSYVDYETLVTEAAEPSILVMAISARRPADVQALGRQVVFLPFIPDDAFQPIRK